ncbi:MAG: Gar1/Naf1 family protein [Methanomassiliicoccales archaeon]
MRFLGEVNEITSEGKLIVRASFAPRPKETVFDNRKRPLGRVGRIFGPVSSPYVSVELTNHKSLLSAMGMQVYVEGVDEFGKGGKRRGR